MKKIIVLIAILCCVVNARILTYSKTINHVKCTFRVNPEKGRAETGKCNIRSIYFMDKDNMLVASYDDTLDANGYYYKLYFFEDMNDAKEVVKIMVHFVEPEDPAVLRKAKRNHYHFDTDGKPVCDTGYYWTKYGDRCTE